jgi:predicted membrane-bound spermidine synthase
MIPLIVFLSGCIVMSFEILGSRILAPHFGNDIFVWGSLIGVFLGGLTVGYWAGGKLADYITDLRCFALLLLLPGLNLCLLPLYYDTVNFWIFDRQFGIRVEPLLASTILFFPPLIFFGAVIPYAVKLQVKNMDWLGRKVGNLYALSSIGSIVGTILTAFYLITLVGVRKIIVGEGVLSILMSLSVFGFYLFFKGRHDSNLKS